MTRIQLHLTLDVDLDAGMLSIADRVMLPSDQLLPADDPGALVRAFRALGPGAILTLTHPAGDPRHPVEHTRDSDCTVGSDGLCIVCGVDHSGPTCRCGGRAFHRPGCERMRGPRPARHLPGHRVVDPPGLREAEAAPTCLEKRLELRGIQPAALIE